MTTEQVITLPPGVAISIIAFLLALLPAGLFIWVWYLRRADRPVPGSVVAAGWLAGLAIVWPAFQLERMVQRLWEVVSPRTVHFFVAPVLPLQSLVDVGLLAVGTFLVVALVEEGLRWLVLRLWIGRDRRVDQVFDGLVLGVAVGLGFATLENTLYFLDLFHQEHFDTLVFIFFLRFLISTAAHVSFGGLMGALLARGVLTIDRRRALLQQSFLLPWFLHGLFDLLLGLNLAIYAVAAVVPVLVVLTVWIQRRDFFVINRKNGTLLELGEAPQQKRREVVMRLLHRFDSPWNKYAPWLAQRARQGALLRQLLSEQ